MKAITLLQPWASLWAANPTLKLHETRSWPTKHRGPIAIHAGAGKDKAGREFYEKLWTDPHFKSRMEESTLPREFDALPFGCVLATTTITNCLPTERIGIALMFAKDSLDLSAGDFSPVRFAWRRGPVTPLPKPIPAKGRLGLWNWNSPEAAAVAKTFDIIVVEEVYHRFTIHQLPDDLRQRLAQDRSLDDESNTVALTEWFCELHNPFAEAEHAEVRERTVTIE